MPTARANLCAAPRDVLFETALLHIRNRKRKPEMNGLKKRLLLMLAPLVCVAADAAAQTGYSVRSPDGRIEVRVRTGERVRYDVLLKGRALLQDSTMSLNVDGKTLGLAPKVVAAKERSHDAVVEPPV